ncbi:DUF4274 domain-containing protein [Novosphingobium sp. BL-52-GroH]|uniref:DUF4274 domain-containing protein n=1 Tax=Novosphingobium sp. BL-52-GroH TaxID=3349877 RepID=UPI00384D1234
MDDDDEMERLRAWLPGQGPKTWHQVALSWNWGNGTTILDWLLDQPDCDRGTAIALYLLGDPDFYAERFPSLEAMREAGYSQLKTAEFLAGICRRWGEGAFPDYRFHPGFWWGDASSRWQEVPPGMVKAIAPWPVPASMVAIPLRGEAVDISRFTEGMPNAWIAPQDETRSLLARLRALLALK